jgi:CheY-like chemotaxis protein
MFSCGILLASSSRYKLVNNLIFQTRACAPELRGTFVNQRRILLVDDEPGIRFVLSAVLEQSGYAVDLAEDGFVALRKIQQKSPDLVITDLRMPNMNGFELLFVIRTRFPELPTIAISGEFLTVSAQQGPLADAFFQKGNYAVKDFLDKISELLATPHRTMPEHPANSRVWTPTGDAPVMLTCTKCLRSFPIDVCEGATPPKQADCIFCGALLDIQLFAVGTAANAG